MSHKTPKVSKKSKGADKPAVAKDDKSTAPTAESTKSNIATTSDSTDSSEGKPAKPSEAKSQKQTTSANDVHYGYFSSVRTPAYRQGWGDIFGKRKSSSTRAKKSSAKKKATSKKPVTLDDADRNLDDARRLSFELSKNSFWKSGPPRRGSATAPSKKKATIKKPATLETDISEPPKASICRVLLRWTRRTAPPRGRHLQSPPAAPTRHELEFNKVWVRENPDLAIGWARKFHAEYNGRYKISINDEKYYITYVADLRKGRKAMKGK